MGIKALLIILFHLKLDYKLLLQIIRMKNTGNISQAFIPKLKFIFVEFMAGLLACSLI